MTSFFWSVGDININTIKFNNSILVGEKIMDKDMGEKTLSRKVAIVPGAIRGIGLEIARELGREGAHLVLPTYDWLDDLPFMKAALDELGVRYVEFHADLREEREARNVVEVAKEEFGRIDILINNIERGGWPVVHGPYTEEQWRLEWETTVDAKWHLFKNALPHLKKTCGCVINITSIAGLVGRSGPAGLVFNDGYSAANRAVSALTEQWAREGAPEVRVNEIQLGFFETRHGPATRGWGILSDEERQAILDHTLVRRVGRPQEVAKAVSFLVKECPFMTGATLRLDGGYLLGGERVPPMPEGVVEPGEPTFGGTIPPGG